MAQVPHRLQPDTALKDNLALASDNFDKIVQDMSEIGAKFSTAGNAPLVVGPDTIFTQDIGVTDPKNQYKAGQVQIAPRMEIFVDNDADDAYSFPSGASLSAGQLSLFASIWVVRRPLAAYVAYFVFQIWNRDVVSHTYYVYVDESLSPSPPTGVFR